MGIIRFLLAVIVMLTHYMGYDFAIGSSNSVRIFFCISGFLMFYILCYKKNYKNNLNFFTSRFLRIYPIYFFITLISLISMLIINDSFKKLSFFNLYKSIPLDGLLYLIFANTTLLFQDLAYFLTISDNKLTFTSNFALEKILIWKGLILPQAWTVSIELMFYLIAPFIFRNIFIIILFFFISLAIKVFITTSNFNYDPWSYRFFFGELFFFLFGALSCKIILPFYKRNLTKTLLRTTSFLSIFFSIFSIFFLFSFLDNNIYSIIIGLVIILLLLPLLFIFSSYFKFDKNFGELSYPIFLSHMFIWHALTFFKLELSNENTKIVLISLCTIIFSYFLNKFISRPIEIYRKKFKK